MCAPSKQRTEERVLQRRLCEFFAANRNTHLEPVGPKSKLLLPLVLAVSVIPAIWQLVTSWRREQAQRNQLRAYAKQVEEQLQQLAEQQLCIKEQEKVIVAHQLRIHAQEVRIQAQMARIDAEQGIAEQWRTALERSQSETLEATTGANRRLLDALCNVVADASSMSGGRDSKQRGEATTLTSSTCSPAHDATPVPVPENLPVGTCGARIDDVRRNLMGVFDESTIATEQCSSQVPAPEVTAARALAMWEKMAAQRGVG